MNSSVTERDTRSVNSWIPVSAVCDITHGFGEVCVAVPFSWSEQEEIQVQIIYCNHVKCFCLRNLHITVFLFNIIIINIIIVITIIIINQMWFGVIS